MSRRTAERTLIEAGDGLANGAGRAAERAHLELGLHDGLLDVPAQQHLLELLRAEPSAKSEAVREERRARAPRRLRLSHAA